MELEAMTALKRWPTCGLGLTQDVGHVIKTFGGLSSAREHETTKLFRIGFARHFTEKTKQVSCPQVAGRAQCVHIR